MSDLAMRRRIILEAGRTAMRGVAGSGRRPGSDNLMSYARGEWQVYVARQAGMDATEMAEMRELYLRTVREWRP